MNNIITVIMAVIITAAFDLILRLVRGAAVAAVAAAAAAAPRPDVQ